MLAKNLYHCFVNIRNRTQSEREHFTAMSAFLIALCYEYNRIAKRHGLLQLATTLRLHLRHSEVKLCLRTEATDYRVFRQIFIENEYAVLEDVATVTNIVDCGANVGYSSLYFLDRFPHARVIAIEPDPANAIICEENLRPYGKRATVIRAAIWPQKAHLAIIRGEYRDGGAWATQVRPLVTHLDNALTTNGIDMSEILQILDGSPIDILKIDIERSELDLFGSHTEQWLTRVRNVAIELHDDECREVFMKALHGFTFELQHSGELTIARNLRAQNTATCPAV
jgi:FkbM family methyltransferase